MPLFKVDCLSVIQLAGDVASVKVLWHTTRSALHAFGKGSAASQS